MKTRMIKILAAILAALSMFSILGGCGAKTEVSNIDELVNTAVQSALNATLVPTVVTIKVDDRQVTIEDATGISIQQMLDQANITLQEDDFLTIETHQTLSGNVTLQVVRAHEVTLSETVDATEPNTPTPTDAPVDATQPAPSDNTIVSVEIYEDCDGSGHGVKVITYADGTQEEVPF